MNLFTGVSNDVRATVATGGLNNTTVSPTINVGDAEEGQFPGDGFPSSGLVAAWREGTYATPDLDPLARIGLVTARTRNTLTITWGQYGTPISALAGTPTVALLFHNDENLVAVSRLMGDLVQQVNGRQFETVSVNKTLDEGDNGVVQVVDTDGVVVTLPATSAGATYIVRNGSTTIGSVGLSVSPNSADKIMGNGFTSADNKDAINTKATARPGDELVLVGDGAAGWVVQKAIGIWARE